MHERDRPERRFADRSASQRDACGLADRYAPDGRQLHEQIVGMLSIDQWASIERLAGLKHLTVPLLPNGRRIQTQHACERELTARRVSSGHAHPPVRRDELVTAARASLVIEFGEDETVLHELPAVVRGHV